MTDDTNYINDDLLIRYLLQETDPGEQQMVEDWLDADAAHRRHFEAYQLIWEESRNLPQPPYVNEELAWRRMQRKIHGTEIKRMEPPVRRLFSHSGVAAASVILITGAMVVAAYLFTSRPPQTSIVRSEAQIVKDTLPDGSIVTLNKSSVISYPERFKGATREITLAGEAFFNITPNKDKPFIIKTGNLVIRVVGTSFNVRSTNNTTEVIVETGVVEVTKNAHTIRLKPKEKMVARKESDQFVTDTVQDRLYNYYASREFVCVNTPLWKLVEILNEAYDVHIVIERPALKKLPLTTTFNNESLDKVLLVISQTFNISVDRGEDSIILQ